MCGICVFVFSSILLPWITYRTANGIWFLFHSDSLCHKPQFFAMRIAVNFNFLGVLRLNKLCVCVRRKKNTIISFKTDMKHRTILCYSKRVSGRFSFRLIWWVFLRFFYTSSSNDNSSSITILLLLLFIGGFSIYATQCVHARAIVAHTIQSSKFQTLHDCLCQAFSVNRARVIKNAHHNDGNQQQAAAAAVVASTSIRLFRRKRWNLK